MVYLILYRIYDGIYYPALLEHIFINISVRKTTPFFQIVKLVKTNRMVTKEVAQKEVGKIM